MKSDGGQLFEVIKTVLGPSSYWMVGVITGSGLGKAKPQFYMNIVNFCHYIVIY